MIYIYIVNFTKITTNRRFIITGEAIVRMYRKEPPKMSLLGTNLSQNRIIINLMYININLGNL
jgi:hypothetical protein